MRFRLLAAITAAGVVTGAPAGAFAFDRGCGRAVECYEKVRLLDRYQTRLEPVLVRPPVTQVIRTAPVVAVRSERVEMVPARWDRIRHPAVYGAKAERVLVAPARTEYVEEPAVTRTVRERLVVRPASVRWEHRRGFLGHGERMCKVVVPAETREVTRDVVVSPARRVARVTPAVYETRMRPVLLQSASVEKVYRPAVHGWVHHNVVVRPGRPVVLNHPPLYDLRYRQVLVGSGGYGWRRSW